jgi:DNA-3-methyladenine glycosylase
MKNKKLPRKFYLSDDTIQLARKMLGKLLVVPHERGNRMSGMIVETEAYLGIEDKAAHSYGSRRTARNEVTYGPGGHAYVFFVYGMYHQLNFVTGPAEHPHVVLIRAVEPVEGIEVMRARRGPMKDRNLTSGPGKLCIAFAIDRTLNGADLTGDRIWLEDRRSFADEEISAGKRVGIDYAAECAEMPWRFWVKDNQFVSKAPHKNPAQLSNADRADQPKKPDKSSKQIRENPPDQPNPR